MSTVTILEGTHRKVPVINETFEMITKVKTTKDSGTFLTVKPNATFGDEKLRKLKSIRISVPSETSVSYESIKEESDQEIMSRIGERFEILDVMTKGSITNDVRAMIVVGPPGVGKSYGVEKQLEKASLFDKVASRKVNYEIVKGAITPIGLYATLYNNSSKNNVLVFDDCDSMFYDDLSLNLLKAALDTNKKRTISWHSASSYLEKEGIPDSFNFQGSVIFITNVNFNNIKSKKLQEHLSALRSRCHYVDLSIDTPKEKFLRIKQIHESGALFNGYDVSTETGNEIIDWIDENKHLVNELSLRLAIKAVELVNISPIGWRKFANATLIR